MVHRGQDAEVAVGDRDARVLEPALLRSPRCPAGLALLNLGLVELLEVRLDDRAVELPPADTAEVGEDGRQAPQRRVEELAQLVVLGVLVGFNELGGVVGVGSAMGTVAGFNFCCFACCCLLPNDISTGLLTPRPVPVGNHSPL